jgi:hypothetical protein
MRHNAPVNHADPFAPTTQELKIEIKMNARELKALCRYPNNRPSNVDKITENVDFI